MQGMSYKIGPVTIFAVLVYCLNSWAIQAPSQVPNTLEVQGRQIHADEFITKEIRQRFLTDINALIAQNSLDLQGIDFEEMKRRSQTIVVFISEGEPFVGSGYRSGGVNFAQNHAYVHNLEKLRSYTPTQKYLNNWHEGLGAMGYDDDNNLASTSLVQKLTKPDERLHPRIKERLKEQLDQPQIKEDKSWKNLKSGGATGVGGGGDGDIAEIRWAVFSYVSFLVAQNQLGSFAEANRLIDLAIDTPIESTEFISEYANVSDIAGLKIGLNQFTGKLCLLVDPKNWIPVDHTGGKVGQTNIQLLNKIVMILKASQEIGGLN